MIDKGNASIAMPVRMRENAVFFSAKISLTSSMSIRGSVLSMSKIEIMRRIAEFNRITDAPPPPNHSTKILPLFVKMRINSEIAWDNQRASHYSAIF